jgi:hypothetical protein
MDADHPEEGSKGEGRVKRVAGGEGMLALSPPKN